jgi:hypothetical protein
VPDGVVDEVEALEVGWWRDWLDEFGALLELDLVVLV